MNSIKWYKTNKYGRVTEVSGYLAPYTFYPFIHNKIDDRGNMVSYTETASHAGNNIGTNYNMLSYHSDDNGLYVYMDAEDHWCVRIVDEENNVLFHEDSYGNWYDRDVTPDMECYFEPWVKLRKIENWYENS